MGSHIVWRVLVAAALLTGCTEYHMAADRDWMDTAEGISPPGDSDTDGDPSVEPSEHPVWFGLDGALVLEDGVVLVERSHLVITLWSQERDAPVCRTTRSIESVELLDSEPDLHGLWKVTAAEGEGCEDHAWPRTVDLGIGVPSAQLAPAADASGLSWQSLYGLYASVDGPLYVYGVAGTDAHFDGEAEVTDPLPDGDYVLRGLHLLPL